jgi:hypothetical protein
MTPKEKGIDLFVKYYERLPDDTYSNEGAKSEAKECALIAVDEIFFAIQDLPLDEVNWNYWQEVKQEINKL